MYTSISRNFLWIAFFCVGIQEMSLAEVDKGRLLYLLPAFVKSTVKMKNGEAYEVPMDYNTVLEQMVFEQKGEKMALGNPEAVDTVLLGNRPFVYVGAVFYEVLVNAPVSLFIQHKSKIVYAGDPIGFGATSQAARSTSVSPPELSGAYYNLELHDKDYTLHSESQYWIRRNNILYKANSEKQVFKIFPEKAEALKLFIRQNKLDIYNMEDFAKLISYCNTLIH